MVEIGKRDRNGEMEHWKKGGNDEKRWNTKKLVKNVFWLLSKSKQNKSQTKTKQTK